MRRFRWDNNRPRLAVVGLIVMVGAVTGVGPPASADAGRGGLSEQSRLADRRFVAIGDRAYEVGAEDARYPATGWHIRGEMGGFWSPPIKLLDGLWFAVDGQWLSASRFTSGRGFVTMDLAGPGGLQVRRTDVVPDGARATLVGLTFSGPARRLELSVDAHSELLSAYPWGWTTPSQETDATWSSGRRPRGTGRTSTPPWSAAASPRTATRSAPPTGARRIPPSCARWPTPRRRAATTVPTDAAPAGG
jgi:hypothetical protein